MLAKMYVYFLSYNDLNHLKLVKGYLLRIAYKFYLEGLFGISQRLNTVLGYFTLYIFKCLQIK